MKKLRDLVEARYNHYRDDHATKDILSVRATIYAKRALVAESKFVEVSYRWYFNNAYRLNSTDAALPAEEGMELYLKFLERLTVVSFLKLGFGAYFTEHQLMEILMEE